MFTVDGSPTGDGCDSILYTWLAYYNPPFQSSPPWKTLLANARPPLFSTISQCRDWHESHQNKYIDTHSHPEYMYISLTTVCPHVAVVIHCFRLCVPFSLSVCVLTLTYRPATWIQWRDGWQPMIGSYVHKKEKKKEKTNTGDLIKNIGARPFPSVRPSGKTLHTHRSTEQSSYHPRARKRE